MNNPPAPERDKAFEADDGRFDSYQGVHSNRMTIDEFKKLSDFIDDLEKLDQLLKFSTNVPDGITITLKNSNRTKSSSFKSQGFNRNLRFFLDEERSKIVKLLYNNGID